MKGRNRRIAKKYALALAQSLKREETGKARELLENMSRIWNDLPEFRSLMLNPSLSQRDKEKIIINLCEDVGTGEKLTNFMRLLVRNKRIQEIEEISRVFREIVDEMEGNLRLVVSTANELSPEEKDELRSKLSRALTKDRSNVKNVVVEWRVEPSLVGGIRILTKDKVYDLSIDGAWNRLRSALSS